jgi:hypothetical protein
MKYLVAAAAAFSILGGTAAVAQPFGYGGAPGYYGQTAYVDPYYGGGYGYGGAVPYGYGQPYGYVQPYGRDVHAYGGYAYGAPIYRADRHGLRAFGHAPRRSGHLGGVYARARHYSAPHGGGYRRHH